MHMFLVALFALVATASAQFATLKSVNGDVIPGSYIVVFHANSTETQMNAHLYGATPLAGVKHHYRSSIKGFAAAMLPMELAKQLASPIVDFIEPDQMMHASTTLATCGVQNTDLWGLKRIATEEPILTGPYKYHTDGAGVTAYIVDTGVRTTHKEFGGRATFGFKAQSSWSSSDGNGHGTHVASTVGGENYGVAKKVSIVAVKVLSDSGSGSNSGVIAGIEYVASEAKKDPKKKGVANMSLGGGKSSASNNAVTAAVAAGVVFVVAAGNDNRDCVDYSPASAEAPITVGSSDIASSAGKQEDIRSYFSNFGAGLDIFAPGSDITGAWNTGDTATNTISGTSMASPHVCGAAALLRNANPSASPAQVKQLLTSGGANSNEARIALNCGSYQGKQCESTVTNLLLSTC